MALYEIIQDTNESTGAVLALNIRDEGRNTPHQIIINAANQGQGVLEFHPPIAAEHIEVLLPLIVKGFASGFHGVGSSVSLFVNGCVNRTFNFEGGRLTSIVGNANSDLDSSIREVEYQRTRH